MAKILRCDYGQIPSTLKTVSALQFHLAQRKGFFTREGIALEVLPIEGGAANMVLALSKGIVDITRTATPYLIQDVLQRLGKCCRVRRNRNADLQLDR
jgi:ABC-type nitrate/sulfonate/bicarbonate transport system substrate-binding protein